MSMADLNEFGYWWVYDLTPEQLEKYNGPSKRSEKSDEREKQEKTSEPKNEETKKELTETLSTNLPQTEQDKEPEEVMPEEDEKQRKLRTESFRIDSVWWTVENRRYRKVSDQRTNMKVNPEKDVFEYWNKQSFLTYEALIREISKAKGGISKKEIEKKYLPTSEQLAFRIGDPRQSNSKGHGRYYSNFYQYNCKHQIRGIWSPGEWHFPMQEWSVGYYLWLVWGKYAYLSDEWWSVRWGGKYPLDLVWASALLFKEE